MGGVEARDLELIRTRLAELSGVADPTIVVADDLGLIVHVDRAFAEALGWRPDELLGAPLTVIIPKRFREGHHIGFSRFLTSGRSVILDRSLPLRILTRSGVEREVEHTITAMRRDGGHWVFAAACRLDRPREEAPDGR